MVMCVAENGVEWDAELPNQKCWDVVEGLRTFRSVCQLFKSNVFGFLSKTLEKVPDQRWNSSVIQGHNSVCWLYLYHLLCQSYILIST